MLDRIAAVDGKLKSYATVMREQALEAAKRAEEEIQHGRYQGPLHGVPIAVKDLCYTKGVRTMAGTSIYAGFLPDHDATAFTKLSQAGAVLLGKLNLTEGAMGATILHAIFLSILGAKICGPALFQADPGWQPRQGFATDQLAPIQAARFGSHQRPTELWG